MNNTVLVVGSVAAALAIGAAYDLAKKAWNKRFSHIESDIPSNRSVAVLGLAATCLSAGYVFATRNDAPGPGDIWAGLGLAVGFGLTFHDNIMKAWAAVQEVVLDRHKKAGNGGGPEIEPFSDPELKALRDENNQGFAELKKRVDALKQDRAP